MFDHCWSLRKLVWVFEFWNGMLVSNIRCKICWKALSFRMFSLEFWKERGEKLMTCHLFLDNFLRIYDLWVVFKGLRVLKQNLVLRKLKYLNFDIMKCSSFLNLVFCKDVLLQKRDCVFVLAIRGLLHMIKNFVLWCDFVF